VVLLETRLNGTLLCQILAKKKSGKGQDKKRPLFIKKRVSKL